MLTLDELKAMVKNGEIETVITAFPDLYGRFMGKRITSEFFLSETANHGMHACDYLFTVDMDMEPIKDYKFANWELGYGDVHAVADMSTLRKAAWMEKSAFILCDVLDNSTHEPVTIAPRTLLNRQITEARKMGFTAMGASELEYYIFKDSFSEVRSKGHQNLEHFGAYIEDYHILQGGREEKLNAAARKHLSASGVPVEFSKGEWGPGQHELNIRYSDLKTMADRHTIYKHCFKDIADSLEISVSFMAKLDENLAGSSCHMHVSLWDEKSKSNLFAGNKIIDQISASNEFRWFLGGWILHTVELMPFYAPTVNSYKRYQSGSWAPTALAWSYDNRTAGFRIVGKDQSLRIESRIAGADVNPYLAYAAIIASGLDGVRNKIDPPEMFVGDVYSASKLPQVPKSLSEAVSLFEKSSFAKKTFGRDVVEHYTHFYKTECAAYDKAVTDWERKRYFEQI